MKNRTEKTPADEGIEAARRDAPKYAERAIYTGRRVSQDGKKFFQVFLKPNGEEMLFKGVKGVWLGYTYECSATQISTRPKRIDDVPRVDNPEWEARDALVDKLSAERNAEKKLAKRAKPGINAAIEALRPLVKSLKFSYERHALIEYLYDKASVEPKKRRAK